MCVRTLFTLSVVLLTIFAYLSQLIIIIILKYCIRIHQNIYIFFQNEHFIVIDSRKALYYSLTCHHLHHPYLHKLQALQKTAC